MRRVKMVGLPGIEQKVRRLKRAAGPDTPKERGIRL